LIPYLPDGYLSVLYRRFRAKEKVIMFTTALVRMIVLEKLMQDL